MNVQKESQLGAHAIMWAVTNKRQEVEDLLKRNGFKPLMGGSFENFKPTALASWVKKALMTNSFRADFLALMAQYPEWATSYMSMNGEFANVSGGVADSSLNLTTAIGTDAPKKTWFTADNIQNTLNTGLNAFLALDKNKTDRELAGASRDVAMYNAQTGGTTGGTPSTTKSNTMLYVILGVVGLALVGGVIYVATKKR
jgi:hypothetical protein